MNASRIAPVVNQDGLVAMAVSANKYKSVFRYIDLRYLHETCPGNEGFVISMLDIFRKGSVKHMEKIRECFAAEDYSGLKMIAHTIKPTGSYIGAIGYTELAQKLEESAAQQNSMQITTLISLMQETTTAIIQEINTYLGDSIA